jgi:uracil-DNA glycosylase
VYLSHKIREFLLFVKQFLFTSPRSSLAFIMAIKSLHADWNELLNEEFSKAYFLALSAFVNAAYLSKPVYPPRQQVFNAFNLCLPSKLKVVIIGQDPYHQAGQANGLSFSVNNGVRIPPSLKNIFKELEQDIQGFCSPASGNLEAWARQGVLLLNTVLTVEDSQPGSHRDSGWLQFTDAVIRVLSERKEHVVFMLWGNYATSKDSRLHIHHHWHVEPFLGLNTFLRQMNTF